ncbi:MAG: 30S ribosomal protein S4 [Bdellovibrio sp. CG12_big_fil_rev_8_21_14_0_65_39_13]|nr:MAG: 30S ribosomal protein S4 [Bdellovibrio sp. CG22_combo_CG10-13_8_21_14_all_39_27]PIQ62418.1 MAG: 30S ribosomal protein S4 [Bdellovibrio sp. CG12_big_fil_rev_8_21_14_0_65_39_13]PIR34085.1 MAG: 30S ribosomal protein S4 [Bdellovibrio sp. CG11_big_fil_rev_8_21_14_0_20_39_38]PJB53030.1 MAG: 30S ribosomal protein S4 [Bdellovibrio sp. CG_4_9_14_3_um_filter_39_7]
MARSTTGRARFKLQRALGLELPGLGKAGALERRPYGPGQHGNVRKKISDYAVRLKEKQKLVYHYSLREKQLVTYVRHAKRDKSRAWIDTLVINLECRLANVVFRLNWAPSMLAANQMVSHGQVKVNGKVVDRASFSVSVGDTIELTDKGYNNQNYKVAQERPRLPSVPASFNIEGTEKKKAVMSALPLAADVPFEFQGQLVIEHYWKVK